MKFRVLADCLGVENYPEIFEKIYETLKDDDYSVCDVDTILFYEEKYGAFGEYCSDVIAAAEDLKKNEKLMIWARLLGVYVRDYASAKEIETAPFPNPDGSIASDMIRLLVLLPLIPRCVKLYGEHGFEQEEITKYIRVIRSCIDLTKTRTGKPGFMNSYYTWLRLFLCCEIFDYGSFNFQFKTLTDPVMLFKNKTNGEHVLFMTEGVFHRTGAVLGSAGFEDEYGSFNVDFRETDSEYIGHAAINGLISPKKTVLKKAEWECVVKTGDELLSVHIPSKTDLSMKAIKESYRGGLNRARERFPEHSPKYLFCASWIIDPQLEKLLGDNSKIVEFGRTYLRYPKKCKGRDGFSFVFLGYSGPDEELPENTSLQRKIKELYLNGGFTYSSCGFVTNL